MYRTAEYNNETNKSTLFRAQRKLPMIGQQEPFLSDYYSSVDFTVTQMIIQIMIMFETPVW